MNLFTLLMISSLSSDLVVYRAENDAYCQNLYWQPDAESRLDDAGCNVDVVTAQIMQVKSGRYE